MMTPSSFFISILILGIMFIAVCLNMSCSYEPRGVVTRSTEKVCFDYFPGK
jgi:hypothetical protein